MTYDQLPLLQEYQPWRETHLPFPAPASQHLLQSLESCSSQNVFEKNCIVWGLSTREVLSFYLNGAKPHVRGSWSSRHILSLFLILPLLFSFWRQALTL